MLVFCLLYFGTLFLFCIVSFLFFALLLNPAFCNTTIVCAYFTAKNYLLCRSPGYGLTLVSESTEGMMHAANGSSHSKQFSVSTSGVAPPTPMLPEDIGRQTALLLIEERVRVSQGRRHQYSRQKADMQNCSIIQLNSFL